MTQYLFPPSKNSLLSSILEGLFELAWHSSTRALRFSFYVFSGTTTLPCRIVPPSVLLGLVLEFPDQVFSCLPPQATISTQVLHFLSPGFFTFVNFSYYSILEFAPEVFLFRPRFFILLPQAIIPPSVFSFFLPQATFQLQVFPFNLPWTTILPQASIQQERELA